MLARLLENDRAARRLGLALLAFAVVLIAVSVAAMAQRLAEHNRQDPPVPFATIRAQDAEFTYRGVDFALTTREDAEPPSVEIAWADRSVTLPVTGTDVPALPGLVRHRDWLAVLMIAEGAQKLGDVEELVRSGAIPARLVVVARASKPGEDPETWGAAAYKDYVYTYLELGPDGSVTRSERTYREIYNDVSSWRHVAAMQVTGGLNTPSSRGVSPISYPNYAGVKEAMTAMGWTWPAFGVAAVAGLAGVILTLGSLVSRKPGRPVDAAAPPRA